MAGPYARLASRLAGILGRRDCALAGGLAVAVHGYVRATRDVDLIVAIPLGEARERLAGRGIHVALHRGDPLEGGFECLKGRLAGIPFDVLPQLVAVPWERLERVKVERNELLVVDLDTLIRLKLKAQGAKDLMDAAALVLRHPEVLERARELALSYRVRDRLDRWLADARLKADVRRDAGKFPAAGKAARPRARRARGRRSLK